ncbi:hypothetical protein [Novosphingobium sp. 9U]|uniref:hypothetical protein n=1 Tax=Novosphingobium sp. 9U TaxID=2653158 RepID=UPI0012F154B8|nr:hypothetical protein [Novosphingobium sp. 9U]VWX54394.1 hypothetical protein NOVOSPHI9U_600009 [Novosphingobium sp. 9U]
MFYAEDRVVQMLANQRWDIHCITFLVEKARELISVLQRIVEVETLDDRTRQLFRLRTNQIPCLAGGWLIQWRRQDASP